MLDGTEFIMESSTASAVDPAAPTRFWYSENRGLVWGNYVGDTVTEGRFVGERHGRTLTVHFVHTLKTDASHVSGSSTSTIDGEPGSLRLVEAFVVAGADHVSVCTQV
ncbi:MAG: hypothetical protein JWM50_1686 [Microbacteriaceae bacterium]|jgi:hypothetical protein|nr:hypothetical protein [Microbacteriaceae bacterium]